MKNLLGVVIGVVFCVVMIVPVKAQEQTANTSTTTCTFEDGKEVSVRYNPAEFKRGYEIPSGKPWAPNDVPMLLFTPTDLIAGNTTIPTGAYSMYIMRNKGDWTLIINRNVTEGSPYDAAQDVVKLPMGTGRVSSPRNVLSVYFGHIAPKVCSIQISFGDTGAFADLKQK